MSTVIAHPNHPVVSQNQWLAARKALLAREKELVHLRDEILHPGTGFNGTLPGVNVLLDALEPREDVYLGLLTGNFKDGAQVKLERFDLWRYFRCGAFGDDAPDRNALVPVALERAAACGMPAFAAADVIVVGDTPNDVACAQAVGAVPIGVATGGYTADQLRQCGADIVFETLEDAEAFVRLL